MVVEWGGHRTQVCAGNEQVGKAVEGVGVGLGLKGGGGGVLPYVFRQEGGEGGVRSSWWGL